VLVVLQDDSSGKCLPRGGPTVGAALDTQARRIVRQITGLNEQYLEQLYTLSVLEPTGWVVIVAYLGLVRPDQGDALGPGAGWYEVLAFPHISPPDHMVIDYALLRLRAKIGYTTLAFDLLPPTFTLRELQGTYEAILDRPLDKRNFRRRVIAAGMLEPTGGKRREGSHRPALLYRLSAVLDRETYLTPAWAEGP